MEKKTLPSTIELPSVTLKKRNPRDAYAGYDCIESDRQRLREFLPWVDAVKSLDGHLWYINECIKDWAEGKMFDYSLFAKNGSYVGSIGVHAIQWQKDCCEIGYWIHGQYEGKGLISAALKGLEEVLFGAGFNRIEIRCDPKNLKSSGVPKRNQYIYEGVLRKEILVRGEYRDTAVYSKLKSDPKH
jgi:ribosomal-protein-serine acetyltransferase